MKIQYIILILLISSNCYGSNKRYWAFIDVQGNVKSTLSTTGDHSGNPSAVELSINQYHSMHNKKYSGGVWVEKPNYIRHISKKEFFGLFTPTQLEDILQSTNKKVVAWVFNMKLETTINTQAQYFIDGINGLESIGVIGVGEASTIITAAQTLAGVSQ